MLQTAVRRRAIRRAVRTSCQAVSTEAFRLLGVDVMDLSPRGMLVGCDRPTQVGDDVIVSFRAPGRDELWLDAEAVVARIVKGLRWGDAGYSAGLEFKYFERCARNELLARLAGWPPPVPQRRLRSADDRARVSGWSDAVCVRPIVMIAGKPRSVPRGVFAA
jgi:hypothetical protein